ncbi:MAG: hypothetical protein A2150_00515 [Candidatus Muproteobacteria bacterium RBG_16_64_11]|uniref:Helix-turn-helix domain-containing protein n=1 Tax=Candidatus Muproteobacteria bacterium RBG_16_64_11 TaxID=1817758 RepID=A0A1F6T9P4_9PROT|nr:MAG: hypothetical protein A2150_00515 [Candidatus Muproteobacteria bacterium RBG_16_64_11]
MNQNHDADALIDEAQAAEFLGLSIKTLQKWRHTGSGPEFLRLSARCIRYRRRELIEWSTARLKTSTAA